MDKLPAELIYKIFDDLSLYDLYNLKDTNKVYNLMVNNYFKYNNYNHLLYYQFSKSVLNKIFGKHLKLNLSFRQIIYYIITGTFSNDKNVEYPIGDYQIDTIKLENTERDAFGLIDTEIITLSVYNNIERWEKCRLSGLRNICILHNEYLDETNNVVPTICNRLNNQKVWYFENNIYNLNIINFIVLKKRKNIQTI